MDFNECENFVAVTTWAREHESLRLHNDIDAFYATERCKQELSLDELEEMCCPEGFGSRWED